MLSFQARTTWQFNFSCSQSRQKSFCSSAPVRRQSCWHHPGLLLCVVRLSCNYLGFGGYLVNIVLDFVHTFIFCVIFSFSHFLVCLTRLALFYFISGVGKGLKIGKSINILTRLWSQSFNVVVFWIVKTASGKNLQFPLLI